jgi:hypothetical protein
MSKTTHRRRTLEDKVTPRVGRKPGKHSSDEYTQTSIYLPIELRNKVRAKLYEQGKEMSETVEKMLRDWLTKQP